VSHIFVSGTTEVEFDGIRLSTKGVAIVFDVDDVVLPGIIVNIGDIRRQTGRNMDMSVFLDISKEMLGARICLVDIGLEKLLVLSLVEVSLLVKSFLRQFHEIIVVVVEHSPITTFPCCPDVLDWVAVVFVVEWIQRIILLVIGNILVVRSGGLLFVPPELGVKGLPDSQ
jgi:hypothetical protein